jgi:dipeptidyl-peptidase-4
MCLAQAPDVFRVAVSGAPVTHWDGYDTHYTERYMSTPQLNPEGYQSSSVMEHVGGMTGKLLLVHGLIDENVHFRHTARLINALMLADKDYDLLLFPDERHLPREPKGRMYMERKIMEYFLTHLKPAPYL